MSHPPPPSPAGAGGVGVVCPVGARNRRVQRLLVDLPSAERGLLEVLALELSFLHVPALDRVLRELASAHAVSAQRPGGAPAQRQEQRQRRSDVRVTETRGYASNHSPHLLIWS